MLIERMNEALDDDFEGYCISDIELWINEIKEIKDLINFEREGESNE